MIYKRKLLALSKASAMCDYIQRLWTKIKKMGHFGPQNRVTFSSILKVTLKKPKVYVIICCFQDQLF